MSHIFFSYTHEDADFAINLAKDLRQAGVNIWMDQLDLKPGDNWVAAIGQAIKSAQALLVVLSPRSISSKNVLDEVSFARHHGKVIFPALIEMCDLPFGLHSLQYIDFTKDYNSARDECVRSAMALLGFTAEVNTTSPPPRKHSAATRQSPLANAKILWVDDRPENNSYERSIMEKLGATIALCTDTGDALRAVSSWQFDLIISDMGRPSGQQAGYDLLQKLRTQNNTTSFIIYASSNTKAEKDEAKRRGAQGCSNDPRELLGLAIKALQPG